MFTGMSNSTKTQISFSEIVSVEESVVLAEDLCDVSVFALDAAGEYLAVGLENSEVWILKLSWNPGEKSAIQGWLHFINYKFEINLSSNKLCFFI